MTPETLDDLIAQLEARIAKAYAVAKNGLAPYVSVQLSFDLAERLLTALRTSSASPTLFESGAYVLHSGETSVWKINCDALTDGDWFTLAHLIRMRVGRFSAVEGVPTGGDRLARELQPLTAPDGPLLIVDDVLTTGASMEQQRAGREAVGVVVFARDECPAWVTPLFSMVRTSSASPSCAWSIDDVGGDSVWETACGHAFEWTTDGPKENQAAFCCYCGKPLVEIHTSDDEPAAPPVQGRPHETKA